MLIQLHALPTAVTDSDNIQTRMVAHKDRARYFHSTTRPLLVNPVPPSNNRGVVSKHG